MVSRFTLVPRVPLQSMPHRAHDSGAKFARCAAISVYFGKRLNTILLRHRIRKYPDSPVHTLSDSLRIYFFPLWRADLKISGFAVEFAGCVWTDAVPGRKKSRIKKYPDMCGWGVNLKTRLFFPRNIYINGSLNLDLSMLFLCVYTNCIILKITNTGLR